MIKAFFLFYEIFWQLLMPVLWLLSETTVSKWKDGFRSRQAKEFNDLPAKPIWFHAVSVGEFNAMLPILKYFSEFNIIVSTTTASSQALAKKKLAAEIMEGRLQVIYMPFDAPSIIQKTFSIIKPKALIIMETEIWPALIYEAYIREIPTSIINARLADKSFKQYKSSLFLFNWIFNKLSLVLAQSPEDSRKFLELKAPADKVFMTGNMKFAVIPEIKKDQSANLKRSMGFTKDHILMVAASTHPGEESALISMYQELKDKYPNLRLAIAPRHPERFSVVEDLILSAAKVEVVRYSKSNFKETGADNDLLTSNDILLIDTIGDLMNFFAVADIAFVGGTLVDKIGGHNVLEPAAYALPIVIGPFYFKNTDVVELLENSGALEVLESKLALKDFIDTLVKDKERRVIMGSQAYKVVNKNKEVLVTVVDKLKTMLNASLEQEMKANAK